MKKLSIEEKAKRYDETLERARKIHNETKFDYEKGMMEEIFPELAESEDEKKDERIRKDIIWCLKHSGIKESRPINRHVTTIVKDAISWLEQCESDETKAKKFLMNKGYPIDANGTFPTYEEIYNIIRDGLEKQGEQKPAYKVEPKVGDWVVANKCTRYKAKIYSIENGTVEFEDGTFETKESLFNDYHIWSIKDAKDGDVLSYKDEISIYKHDIKNCTKEGTNFGGFVYHCCYDDKRLVTDSLYSLTEKDKKDIHPATKEQREQLERAMADAGYTFDFEKKELKKTNEEFNGEKYGIDSLFHAQRILEKTLGKVDGYQSDDGILEHKCAITAVKKLYKQKPIEWHREDEQNLNACLGYILNEFLRRWLKDVIPVKYGKSTWSEEDEKMVLGIEQVMQCASLLNIVPDKIEKVRDWLKSLKERVQPQPKQEWSEEDETTRNALINLVEMYYSSCINKSEKNRLLSWLNELKESKL